jgi:hypothetical protein
MAMKFLTFHNQLVADFSPDDQDDDFISFDIIQGTQVARAKLELGQRIGAQTFNRPRGCRGLVLQPAQDRCFQDPLLAHRQGPKLPVRVLCDRNLEGHAGSALFMRRVPLPQPLGCVKRTA